MLTAPRIPSSILRFSRGPLLSGPFAWPGLHVTGRLIATVRLP